MTEVKTVTVLRQKPPMDKVVEEKKVAVVESCTDKVAPGEILVADFDQQKNNP